MVDVAGPWRLELTVQAEFEECLEFAWQLLPTRPGSAGDTKVPQLASSTVEMVIDRSGKDAAASPPKDAMVKRIDMGTDMTASFQNMPEGRKLFIAVVSSLRSGGKLRSPWVRAATLHPSTREPDLGNLDPMNKPRLNCECCPCAGYVPTRWTQFVQAQRLRCRRCGCPYDRHVAVDVTDILKAREEQFRKTLGRENVTPLPADAIPWDDRECSLWFLSDGVVHPRRIAGEGLAATAAARAGPGGPEGLDGRSGRVSVVTPTTESRRKFHEALWTCFTAQDWQDKELVVIETYVDQHSDFLERKAKMDPRLIYIRFKRPKDADWSIGLKRNIGAHVASGAVIANFDDDDLYAPTYLTTMVGQLEARGAQAVTLSSWFVVNAKSRKWSFCDPIAWGAAQGLDENAPKVRTWAYGYGFSYLNRRRASLEHPYEDRNMGEDFSFFSRLQLKRTEESVQLVHDDVGICLHTQHGGNTSETFPIREVSRDEALDLDVAKLSLIDAYLAVDEHPSARRGQGRQQQLTAHVAGEEVKVSCPVGTTVAEFLARVLQEAPHLGEGLRVHRVPTAPQAAEALREEAAIEVLGVASVLQELAEKEAEGTEAAGGEAPPRGGTAHARRLLLRRASYAMRGGDRIPPRATDLWLARPGEGAEPEEPCEAAAEAPDEALFTVEVSCQTASAKKYFSSSRTLKAMLPMGADVRCLREVLGGDLPATARVLLEGREHPLQDTEPLPAKVTVTEFTGKRPLYVRFSRSQCARVLDIMRVHLEKPDVQAQLDEMEAKAKGDEFKHKMHLSELLMCDVYPAILRKYGLPCNKAEGLMLVPSAMGETSCHLELLELQLEVERLMRNKTSVNWVLHQIAETRARLGLPVSRMS